MKLVDGIPRRIRVDLASPAELAIRNAVAAVEEAGADVRLTNAVILLDKARDQVADYVDGLPPADTCWFVESKPDGRFEGWWAGPPKGEGGWLTTDPLKAKRYSESEARAVADAMSYFPTPFRWSQWVATEHMFISAADSSVPEQQSNPKKGSHE